MQRPAYSPRRHHLTILVATATLLAASAAAAETARTLGGTALTPGVAEPLPAKDLSRLPRREAGANLTVGADARFGARNGAEGFAELRLLEAWGIGAGVAASDAGAAALLRLSTLGMVINHWGLVGHADYEIGESFAFGAVVLAPVGRDTYLRISVKGDVDGEVSAGVGMEHDVW
jgi:hypothetical protein